MIALGQCNEGSDNDADGLIDVDDPGCLDSLDPEQRSLRRRCGLGMELAFLLPLSLWVQRRPVRN